MCQHQFKQETDGTTIQGYHLHVWKCNYCGLYDFKLEGKDKDARE
jgi:hypothetical protein